MPTYNPQGLKKLNQAIIRQPKESSIYSKKKNPSVQTYSGYPKHLLEIENVSSNKRFHPTQKPVELLEYLIKTYTNTGDLVLDNCMGSGSTGVACKKNGRRFIGIELNEDYFNIAKRRINELGETL